MNQPVAYARQAAFWYFRLVTICALIGLGVCIGVVITTKAAIVAVDQFQHEIAAEILLQRGGK